MAALFEKTIQAFIMAHFPHDDTNPDSSARYFSEQGRRITLRWAADESGDVFNFQLASEQHIDVACVNIVATRDNVTLMLQPRAYATQQDVENHFLMVHLAGALYRMLKQQQAPKPHARKVVEQTICTRFGIRELEDKPLITPCGMSNTRVMRVSGGYEVSAFLPGVDPKGSKAAITLIIETDSDALTRLEMTMLSTYYSGDMMQEFVYAVNRLNDLADEIKEDLSRAGIT